MNFDPQQFSFGLMDFFSILLPGALLTYLLMSNWRRFAKFRGMAGAAQPLLTAMIVPVTPVKMAIEGLWACVRCNYTHRGLSARFARRGEKSLVTTAYYSP